MGVSYEINWYLVIDNQNKIVQRNDRYFTVKSEYRIYPVGMPIPLIIKEEGCVGLVNINSFKVCSYSTEIEFEFMKKFDVDDSIGKHYYDLYLYMKSK